MRRAVRLACLGAGPIVERALFKPNGDLEEPFEVELCSRNRQRAQELRSRYGVVRSGRSFDRILQDPAVAAVYVALPNRLHTEVSAAAMEAGKAVLVEKPVCVTADDVEKFAALLPHAERPVIEGVMLAGHPWLRLVENLVADRPMGGLRSTETTLHLNIPAARRQNFLSTREGGGAWYDLAPYWFAFLESAGIEGVPEVTHTDWAPGGKTEESLTVRLESAGVVARFSASHAKDYRASHHLVFEGGEATIHDFLRPAAGPFTVKASLTAHGGAEDIRRLGGESYYLAQLRRFHASLFKSDTADPGVLTRARLVSRLGQDLAASARQE